METKLYDPEPLTKDGARESMEEEAREEAGFTSPVGSCRLLPGGGLQAYIVLFGCSARRLNPVKAPGGLLGLQVFRSKALLCTFIVFLGLFTVPTYITSSAIVFGISPDFAFYLVSVVNFSAGVFSGQFRNDEYHNVPSITDSIRDACLLFSNLALRAKISVVSPLGGIEDIGRRMEVINTVASFGVMYGPPISGLVAYLAPVADGEFEGALY
ncbi:hypothetical protein B0H11DRAFT_2201167 [Mycena galericulata]|nr:hypothetical protein B0H11DRAFT_2201167 [Mycena galericulata]